MLIKSGDCEEVMAQERGHGEHVEPCAGKGLYALSFDRLRMTLRKLRHAEFISASHW